MAPAPKSEARCCYHFFTGSDLQVERFETAAATAIGIGITFNVGFTPKLVIGIASRATSGAGEASASALLLEHQAPALLKSLHKGHVHNISQQV